MGQKEDMAVTDSGKEMTWAWAVSGMDCGLCAAKIKDAVGRLPGVSDVEIGIMSERLRLTLDEGQTDPGKIEQTVRALGYRIAPLKSRSEEDALSRSEAQSAAIGSDHGKGGHVD